MPADELAVSRDHAAAGGAAVVIEEPADGGGARTTVILSRPSRLYTISSPSRELSLRLAAPYRDR